MHEGALGATTDNPFWGRCDNPALPGHTPGGSSGGSAAAVAAGFVGWAVGTDTMGSVRIPAAYCGLWGLKPTPGAVPTEGLMPLSPTLDTIGPIARTPADLATAFAAMAGQDMAAPPPALRGLRLGLPAEATEVDLDPAVDAAFTAFLARLRAAGVEVVPVAVAGWSPAADRRAGLLISEAEGAAVLAADLDADAAAGGGGFSPAFRALLAYGRAAAPDRIAAARARLASLQAAAAAALQGVAALLLPTAPQRPFPHGAPVPANQADLTALANLARLPAVAFPIAAGDGGFPASAQVLGAPGSEARLVALAAALAP
jgi:aspartyl-tRNA(Asn)/glutamyl-tRNA(Gln) amidotransferase subunit A